MAVRYFSLIRKIVRVRYETSVISLYQELLRRLLFSISEKITIVNFNAKNENKTNLKFIFKFQMKKRRKFKYFFIGEIPRLTTKDEQANIKSSCYS